MSVGIEKDLENAIIANIFYGEDTDMGAFFSSFSSTHFSDENRVVFNAAKNIWASGREIHPASLRLACPEMESYVEKIYDVLPLRHFYGYEVTLGIAAEKKRQIAILKDALKRIELNDEDYNAVSQETIEELSRDGVIAYREPKTIADVYDKSYGVAEVAPTGIKFIDDIFEEDGGFEYAQLVTITGEQEAGKTQLLNQLLFGMALGGTKSVYFSLEFNERSFHKYLKRKNKFGTYSHKAAANIMFYSDEDTSGNIYEVESILRKLNKQYGIRVAAIDSQMMLEAEGIDPSKNQVSKSEEAQITKIYRTLHHLANKLDMLIFIIAQGSKEDNKSKRVEIFGSKRASHLARIMLHMEKEFTDKEEGEQNDQRGFDQKKRQQAGVIEAEESYFCRVAKNKQSGKHPRIALNFDKDGLEFWVDPSDRSVARYSVTTYEYGAGHVASAPIAESLDDFFGSKSAADEVFDDGGISGMMDF